MKNFNVCSTIWTACAIASLSVEIAGAASSKPVKRQVFTRNHNVIVLTGEHAVRVTNEGVDSEPALSPDGSLVVFVRRSGDSLVNTGSGDAAANAIWLIKADGTGVRQLVASRESEKVE